VFRLRCYWPWIVCGLRLFVAPSMGKSMGNDCRDCPYRHWRAEAADLVAIAEQVGTVIGGAYVSADQLCRSISDPRLAATAHQRPVTMRDKFPQ